MLLTRVGCKQLFLGMTILAITSVAHAETKPELPSVLEPGTRFFVGDTAKNEFYILGNDERDPIIKPAFVNAAPMQSGIDTDDVLAVSPDDVDLDPYNVLDEPDATDSKAVAVNKVPVPLKVEQETAENNAPVDVQTESEQPAASTNLFKIKTLLHQMTRKMAEAKKHSRIKMASKVRANHKLHVRHKMLAKRVVKQRESKRDFAVLKVKYIHLA